MRAAAADQAGNDGLEGGIRGKLLGFRRDLRFYRSFRVVWPIHALDRVFLALRWFFSVVVRRLFRNASLVGYPRFFVSQARVFVVLGVCPGTVWYCRARYGVPCYGTGLLVVSVLVPCGNSALDINSELASSVVVRRLFRNASLVGYPRFFVSQARVFVVLGVCPGIVWYCRGARKKTTESLKGARKLSNEEALRNFEGVAPAFAPLFPYKEIGARNSKQARSDVSPRSKSLLGCIVGDRSSGACGIRDDAQASRRSQPLRFPNCLRAWGASVVAISSHHRALGPSWPGPVRQADVALLQGATTFQEQLQGSVSGSCIRVPAAPKNRLRVPPTLFGQRPLLPNRVCSACVENPFESGSTSLHQTTGSKPCLRAPNTEQQVCLTEQATCSVPFSPDESKRLFIT
ncbi:hypothetical protein Taro_026393 [Colocasia esculenta]|uniref:Uncharacterized protein n=1 Tax=Colocasia esculenta TaxID=4460 RepID=A0A843VH03_COLES|nr:hypothetical protein [Colocasia esculenta]